MKASSMGDFEVAAEATPAATDAAVVRPGGTRALDAFAQLSSGVIQLEAIASAAKAAIDAYGLPANRDRDFLRMHALVGAVAKAAAPLVDLAEQLADLHPLEAFERLSIGVIQLEAIANAANAAIDECGVPPSGSRRNFDRVHALVSEAAEAANALVDLGEQLKTSLRRRREGGLDSARET